MNATPENMSPAAKLIMRLERANKLLKDLHDVLNGECEDRGNIDCQCSHCNAEIRTFNALAKYLEEGP